MGTEIVEAQTASLTLAPNSEVGRALAIVSDERELTDEQFAIVESFAEAPPPALTMVQDEDVRKLIGIMAGTLKAARTSTDEGRLKLSVYKRMLGHLPLSALNHATERALATLEWMPTPAELLKLAEEHTAPELRLHNRAKALARHRRQRLFEEELKRIARRELSDADLQELDDYTAKVAQTQGNLIIRLDGSRQYRSKETMLAHSKDLEERAASLHSDERDNRASEAPEEGEKRPKRSGSVGDAAADVLNRVEVSDGE